jgi:HPt (histidine-containing phosphotransfer) domain-containing protein
MPDPSEIPTLDIEVLRDSIGDRPDLVAQVMDNFLVSINAELEMLSQSVNQTATVVVARTAHRIKGAAHTVGALKLAHLSQSIESSALAGDWESVRRYLQCILAAIGEIEQIIRRS